MKDTNAVQKRWRLSDAKQRFSEVVRESVDEPQWIARHDEVVAVVVGGETLNALESWRRAQRASIAQGAEDLRRICLDEDYRLEAPRRRNRRNAFAGSG